MRPIFFVILAGLTLAACEKETNNNPTPSANLSDVIVGEWNVSAIQRTSVGSIQGFPVDNDYTTDSIYRPSTFSFDSNSVADIRYRYVARDYQTNTPYSSGWKDLEGTFSIASNTLYIINSSNDTTVFTASAISQNSLELVYSETSPSPGGTGETVTDTERFTLARVE